MWQRHTQPLAFSGTSWYRRRRLRVVDQAHVPAVGQLAGVHLVVAPPGRPLLLVEVLRRALQGVVHQLGGVEELFAAVDHLPLAVQADVAHQRHERVEDLRDAAAERGRRDVHDALALQRLGQLADFGDQLAPADVRVVGERLVGYGDGLEHAAARYLSERISGVRAPCATEADARNYGLRRCSTGASTARPSCRSCSRSRSPPSRSAATPAAAHLDARARRLRRRARVRRTAEPGRRSSPTAAPGQRRRRGARRATWPRTLEGLGGTAGGGFSVQRPALRRPDDRRRARR